MSCWKVGGCRPAGRDLKLQFCRAGPRTGSGPAGCAAPSGAAALLRRARQSLAGPGPGPACPHRPRREEAGARDHGARAGRTAGPEGTHCSPARAGRRARAGGKGSGPLGGCKTRRVAGTQGRGKAPRGCARLAGTPLRDQTSGTRQQQGGGGDGCAAS